MMASLLHRPLRRAGCFTTVRHGTTLRSPEPRASPRRPCRGAGRAAAHRLLPDHHCRGGRARQFRFRFLRHRARHHQGLAASGDRAFGAAQRRRVGGALGREELPHPSGSLPATRSVPCVVPRSAAWSPAATGRLRRPRQTGAFGGVPGVRVGDLRRAPFRQVRLVPPSTRSATRRAPSRSSLSCCGLMESSTSST